jgi:hypothetical protein
LFTEDEIVDFFNTLNLSSPEERTRILNQGTTPAKNSQDNSSLSILGDSVTEVLIEEKECLA